MEKVQSLLNSPFAPRVSKATGTKTGDKYYHNTKILQVVEDNSIKLITSDDKEPIREKIDTFKDKAGLRNILKMYLRTGDESLFGARPLLNGIDTTALPKESPEAILKKLPSDLVGKDNIEAFLSKISPEVLVKYYQDKLDKEKKQKEGGAEE